MKLIITGIGTDVGKTVVSAIFCKAFQLNYWKPVQAGDLQYSDTHKVAELSGANYLHELYRLNKPMSPHTAALEDAIDIHLDDFQLPNEDHLLIEGAGGLMVPINQEGLTYIDVFEKWNLPVVLVSRHYLGSINHTLLSWEALASRNIPMLGIVFVGETHPNNRRIILEKTKLKVLAEIPEVDRVTPDFIAEQAQIVKNNFE